MFRCHRKRSQACKTAGRNLQRHSRHYAATTLCAPWLIGRCRRRLSTEINLVPTQVESNKTDKKTRFASTLAGASDKGIGGKRCSNRVRKTSQGCASKLDLPVTGVTFEPDSYWVRKGRARNDQRASPKPAPKVLARASSASVSRLTSDCANSMNKPPATMTRVVETAT